MPDMPSENFYAQRVKGRNLRLGFQISPHQLTGSLLHFIRRFVGECDRKNPIGLDAFTNQFGNAKGDNTSLPSSSTR